MKTKLLISLSVIFTITLNAQVGINTTNPEATLHINGNTKINTVQEITSLSNTKILTYNQTTSEVTKADISLIQAYVNTTITKATSSGSTILSGNLFTGWDRLSFTKDPNFTSNFNETTSTYKVPVAGVYAINFKFRYGTGVQLSLLNFGGTPKIGILKHLTTGGYTEINKKDFSGATLPLVLSLLISDTEINSIHKLNKDDILSFEYYRGGISLNLLTGSVSEISIYKISD
ncbi:hypothetical protein SAMN05660477_01754 [Soonwooa buanensis]|uniref:C1q domain-containing protein n=1 Tax=Soonwooa buanensis TaxID=619805 RepID=A0A1T5F3N4_9FLAO|nr:hypothetical protein [Soonwooa buanensis]SKB90638.1 hypothetical protein SAMN05660477_01754 [Soonwooa buanensis]